MNLLYESETFAVMHLLANEAEEGARKPVHPCLLYTSDAADD